MDTAKTNKFKRQDDLLLKITVKRKKSYDELSGTIPVLKVVQLYNSALSSKAMNYLRKRHS